MPCMKLEAIALLLLFVLNVISQETPDEPFTETGVYVLSKNNFEKFIHEHSLVLVEFYAPWCGHCKSFAPLYIEIAKELQKESPSIPVAKVDAAEETELGTRYHVQGYPTLKFFKNGQAYDYDGARGIHDITEFMRKVAKPNWEPPKDHVLTLTKDNFTETIQANDYILVEFYAPWCGHCKSLAPEYAKAARTLSKSDPPIPLATVDAIAEKELAEKYQVSGYPTLKLFRNQKPSEYSGPRYGDGIVEWLIKHKQNAAVEVKSWAELRRLKDPHNVQILGLFESAESGLFAAFTDTTNNMRNSFNSYYSFSSEVHKSLKFTQDSVKRGVVQVIMPEFLHNKYDPKFVEFMEKNNTETTSDLMQTFIEENMFPLVGVYDGKTAEHYDRFPKEFLCFFFLTVDFSIHHRAATQNWMRKFVEIAKDFNAQIAFVMADDEKFSTKVKTFRLDDSGEDINLGCLKSPNTKFAMSPMEEFDGSHIQMFLNHVVQGLEYPVVMSSPRPQKISNNNGMLIMVGDSYRELVDNQPDAEYIPLFVLLHMGSCTSTCLDQKQLLSEFISIGKKGPKVVTMDLSTNELPPTLKGSPSPSEPGIYLSISSPDMLDRRSLLLFSPKNQPGVLPELVEFVKKHFPADLHIKEDL